MPVVARLTVNGVGLAYDVSGAGDPVVFIAGTGMSRIGWALQRPRFDAAGFTTVVFDSRGVGGSDAPGGPYSIDMMADDTAGLIEQLELGPCHLVGLSQGGMIAEALVRRRPELVRAAVLMASAGRGSDFGKILDRADVDLDDALDDVPASVDLAQTLVLLMSSAQLQDDDLVTRWAELAGGDPWSGPGRRGQHRANLEWSAKDDWESSWASVRRPVLVMAFELDVLFPPAGGREAASHMPDAEYVEIAGVGHGGAALKADDAADAAIAFLRRH
jgi:pimeloyl-ACP methyl ester carboxylesterase